MKDNSVKIYCYTNKLNGKKYIGQTCGTLCARAGMGGKKYASSTKFFHDILEFGWGNFEPTILEITTKELADDRERYWINHYDTVNSGYNSSSGGKVNHTFSQATRDRVKRAMQEYGDRYKNRNYTEEFRRKRSETTRKWIAEHGHPLKGKMGELAPMWGKHHSEKTKKIISIKHNGKHNPMYGKPAPNKGKPQTQEAKQKSKLSKAYIVYLTNVENGEQFAFIGAKDASKFVNKSEGRINQCAKVNGVINGYLVSYGGKYKDHKDVKIFNQERRVEHD